MSSLPSVIPPPCGEEAGRETRPPFQGELRARVQAYFAHAGLSPYATRGTRVKAALFVALYPTAYALLVFRDAPWWQAVPLMVLLGCALAGVGFNVQHDGSHGSFSRRRWLNRAASCTLDLIGGSSYVWQWRHVRVHHPHPNCSGVDVDINVSPFLRLAPAQRRYWFHRFQHWYAWGLYALLVPQWHFVNDFRYLWHGAGGAVPLPRPRGAEVAGLVAGKAVFLTMAFGLPALYHPAWAVLAGYLVVSCVAGLIMGTVFQLAHCLAEAEFFDDAAGGDPGRSWAERQLAVTVNFAPTNRLLTWLLGGLNHQIEHHLFPHVGHAHYPRLAPIVRSVCAAYGVPYRTHPTLGSALLSHWRWLRRMGQAPPHDAPREDS